MASDNGDFRDKLSTVLVGRAPAALGALALMAMAGAVYADYFGKKDGAAVTRATEMLFTSILPLIGTWVGTVLAFYFSKDNFEAASRGTLNVVNSIQQRLTTTKVSEAMLAKGNMVVVTIPADKKLGDLAISDIEKLFMQTGPTGHRVSRLAILDGTGVCVGILHRSLLNEMLLTGLRDEAKVDPTKDPLGKLIDKDYPARPGTKYGDFIQKTVAFVGADRTLADAKVEMEKLPGCQDVFVTKTGDPREPILGWISNIDINRLSQA